MSGGYKRKHQDVDSPDSQNSPHNSSDAGGANDTREAGKVKGTSGQAISGTNAVDKGSVYRKEERRVIENGSHGSSFSRHDELERSRDGLADRRRQPRDDCGDRDRDRGNWEGRRGRGNRPVEDYGGRGSRWRDDGYGRDREEHRDSGKGFRNVHSDYETRRRVEGGRNAYRYDDERYDKERSQSRARNAEKFSFKDDLRSGDRNSGRNREPGGAGSTVRDASGKGSDKYEEEVRERGEGRNFHAKNERRDHGESLKNLGQGRGQSSIRFHGETNDEMPDRWGKKRDATDNSTGSAGDGDREPHATPDDGEAQKKRRAPNVEKQFEQPLKGMDSISKLHETKDQEINVQGHGRKEVEPVSGEVVSKSLASVVHDPAELAVSFREKKAHAEVPSPIGVIDADSDADMEAKAMAAKAARASKWGPPADQLAHALYAPQLQAAQNCSMMPQLAALFAARKAAELVNASMGVPGSMTADEKKKLLWGNKKAAVVEEPVAAVGINRWDTVHFADRDREEKFQKLMGVKADKLPAEVAQMEAATGGPAASEIGSAALTEEKQRELQEELERQFAVGMRRRDGRTVGLGL